VEGYAAGSNSPSYDKQFLRDWLEGVKVDGRPWNKQAPAPALPAQVIEHTAKTYNEALRRLTT
jgi:phosphoribosylaminoimidazole-succinocarboxamide synthase